MTTSTITKKGLELLVQCLPSKNLDLVCLDCNDITKDDINNIFNTINEHRHISNVYIYSNNRRYHCCY